MFEKFKLRPTLFGGQIQGVLETLRNGCPEHGKTLSGAPDCKPCRVIKHWEPELRLTVW